MDIVLTLLVGLLAGAALTVLVRKRSSTRPYDDAVGAALGRLDAQLRGLESARAEAYGGVRASLDYVQRSTDALRHETNALVTALRAPHTRGRWGELQLRRVIEAAGALEHCDFSEQVSATTGAGGIRPDVIVHLAGGKQVVIDAKAPCSAWLEAVESRDEQTRQERSSAHARQVREHIKSLSSKNYWSAFDPCPEFVVMFIPADAFLDAALQADPTLQEFAFGSNVVLATPSTLVAMLRTIAYTWRQDALAASTREVSELGRDLYQRLGTLAGYLDKLGRSLSGAVASYNETVGSLESRVLVTARKFGQLGVAGDDPVTPVQVDRMSRRLNAPELVVSGDANGTVVAGAARGRLR
ncbi:MAG: DNA recombination protein RmuC [Actinomycetes bacterium]